MKNVPNLNQYLVFILNVTICGHHCSDQYQSHVNHRHCKLSCSIRPNHLKSMTSMILKILTIHFWDIWKMDMYVHNNMKTLLYFLRMNCPFLRGIRVHSNWPLPLPQWFRHGKLTNKTMLESFPSYIQTECEQFSSIFEELQQIKFKKKPIYSGNVILYALMLRYSSLQAYKLLLEEKSSWSLWFYNHYEWLHFQDWSLEFEIIH